MRILLYLFIFYLIYRFVKYVLTKNIKQDHTQKEFYTYDEYGSLRREKDITNEVKIIEEKKLNDE